ncbi:MAG: autotransporter-associated beta strand repeat-containing protein, partial [Thermoguttaceae bacterium]
MNNVPACFVRLSAGILALGMTVCAAQAETVVQVNLNGYVTGIFGDQVNSYQIQLFDNETPITVANYLKYVNNNAYDNTIIHRSISDFVIQGGGFKLQTNSNNVVTAVNPIQTYSAIQNEAGISNSRGTIAMALPSYADGSPALNSATSQWYINLGDNSGLDSGNESGGYTVFGQVAGEGMTLVDGVAALTTYNLNNLYSGSAFSDVPLASTATSTKASVFVTVVSMNVVSTVAWKGGASSASTDWGTLANWDSGTSVPNGAGVNLSIGSQDSANNVIDLGSANRTVGNIYFTSGTGTTIQSANGYSLILDNNGKTSLINVIGDHTISASVILNNNTLISIDGSLAISGAVSGTGSLALNNTGKLTLTGSNSYTGKTLITSGSLTAGQAASLPGYNTSGMVTVSSGAALIIRAGAPTGEWAESEISALQSNALFNSGAYLAIDTGNGDFTYGSTLGGSLNFAKLGDNALLLTGSNTYSGNTIVVAGTLTAGKAASLPGYNASGMVSVDQGATLAVRAGASSGQWAASDIDTLLTNATFNSGSFLGIDTTGGDFAYGSVITGSMGLTKSGSNTLTLTGSNTFTGAVNFNGGLIKAANPSNLGAGDELNFNGGGLQFDGVFDPSSSTITFQSGGAILDTQANIITMANSIGNGGAGGLTKQGSGTLILSTSPDYNGATVINAGTLQLGSGATLPSSTAVSLSASGATLDINANSQTIASLTGVAGTEVKLGGGALTVGDDTSTTFAGAITSTGTGTLTKTGTGTLTLTGSNTFTGAVNFNGGLINAASLDNLGAGSELNFNGGGLQFNGVYDPSGRTMTFQSGGATLDTNGNDNTLANSIGNGGAGGLTKAGSGVLTLSVSSNYLGTTVVSGGTLKLASGATLPTTTAVSLTASGAALDINGNSQTIASLTGVSGTTLQLGSGSLSVGDNTSTTFAGSITGSSDGKLIKEGTGTLELTGNISYGGD